MLVIDLLAKDQKNLESTINELRGKINGNI
jgi:hypothetical protein